MRRSWRRCPSEFVEAGLRPAWGAVRIGWHMRDADSVVLTARGSRAHGRLCDHALRGRERAPEPACGCPGVPPPAASRGALLTWLEGTRADRRHLHRSAWSCAPATPGARAFYAALGYQECGEVSGYYQGVETAIRLTRDVRASRETPGTREPSP